MTTDKQSIKYVVRSTNNKREAVAFKAADAIIITLVCLGLIALIFLFILRPVSVMSPTVKDLNDNELVLVDRLSKYIFPIKRGDIVRVDIEGGYNEYRVIALSGEAIIVRDGKTYINNAFCDEAAYADAWDTEKDMTYTVPQGMVLVLSDDRSGVDNLQAFAVEKASIYGVLRMRIYPISSINIFG